MKSAHFEGQLKSWITNNHLDELEFLSSQDGTNLPAVWSIRPVPKEMRTFTVVQQYLEIQMDITTDSSLVVIDSTFPVQDVDEDFSLDSAVFAEEPSEQCWQKYRAFIDVLLHPMYEVPCPFIRMYDCRGQLLSAITTQAVVARVFHRPTIGGTDASEATKEKNSVQFTFEEHPYLSIPCLCLHVCGVHECMTMLDLSEPQEVQCAPAAIPDMTGMKVDNCNSSSHNKDSNTDNSASSDIYLLRWFSLVGPVIGLHISPQLFTKLSSSSSAYQ